MTDDHNSHADDAAAFVASLAQRRRSADAMEQDLLTNVPLLYGSPGRHEPEGDPGIVLARLHAEERMRRFGSGLSRTEPKARRFWTSIDGLFTVAALVFLALNVFGIL